MTGRLIAIGDIHGCVNALDSLLDAVSPTTEDQLVVLGDFVDQGHESRLVIDRLIELGDSCQLVVLLGNHEEMLLAARTSEEALRSWEVCGGVQTLNSYHFGGSLEYIPDAHWDFVAQCRDYYETPDHIFVHASFDYDEPLDRQPPHRLRWELLDPENVRCHQSGKTVIVGHTEQDGGEILDLGCVKCIDTACCRYGWLTALDVHSNRIWQASRFGQLRQRDELPVGPTAKAWPAS